MELVLDDFSRAGLDSRAAAGERAAAGAAEGLQRRGSALVDIDAG